MKNFQKEKLLTRSPSVVRCQEWELSLQAPSIAFQHFLSPNSARFGYAADGAHDSYLPARQLSIDAVSALRKTWGTNMTVEAMDIGHSSGAV